VKAVIVGCGRVGSVLADAFDRAGQDVIVIDTSTSAFDRLPGSFGGTAVRGDGTDEDTLRRAGAEAADLFMAMTEGDNRNVMAAQLAVEALGARRVIAKINDPLRAAAYADLGINTLCRTNLMAAAVNDFLGLDLTFGPGMAQATGFHPGGEHHAGGAEGAAPNDAAGSTPTAVRASPAGPAVDAGPILASTQGADPADSSASTSTIEPPASPVAAREG
jgi:trk system potassium uptake protein TrkA